MGREKPDNKQPLSEEVDTIEEVDNLEVFQEALNRQAGIALRSTDYSIATTPNRYITDDVIALTHDPETRWADGRGHSGPAPADFGDHKPIHLDEVCASFVEAVSEDLEGDSDEDTEEDSSIENCAD